MFSTPIPHASSHPTPLPKPLPARTELRLFAPQNRSAAISYLRHSRPHGPDINLISHRRHQLLARSCVHIGWLFGFACSEKTLLRAALPELFAPIMVAGCGIQLRSGEVWTNHTRASRGSLLLLLFKGGEALAAAVAPGEGLGYPAVGAASSQSLG
eukprot:5856589-Pyramimonas_sp.AAC.1